MFGKRKLGILMLQAGFIFTLVDSKAQKKGRKVVHSNEYKIKQQILRRYDKTTRPVKDDRTKIKVNVAISLYHILDTDEKQQTFTCILSIRERWKDEYLVWNKTEYNNVSQIRVPANQIWTPDLVISNFAGEKFNDYMVTNAIIGNEGDVLWLFPAYVKTYCTLDVKYFPFDKQRCNITFISWTFSGFELDLFYNDSFPNIVYYVAVNQEWAVEGITARRQQQIYACCPEPYPDITFTIYMRRGSLFYIFNLIFPCFLIYLISFLGFFLPVESGEKVNLEITILLALVVFLLMVGETMPPTSDSFPILGMYFAMTMVIVTVALVMAVTVTNIYSRKDSLSPCPRWVLFLAKRMYSSRLLPDRPMMPRHKMHKYANQTDSLSYNESEADSLTCGCCLRGCASCANSRCCHRYSVERPHPDFERWEAEWRLVTKFMDRMFFWIFVVLSVVAQTVLFTLMQDGTTIS